MDMVERARNSNTTAPAKKALFELQVEQHHHDEAYHREIARLSLHQRLNHMALHFAKYSGKVAAANDADDVLPVYVDVLIIALSTSNVLNIELWDLLETEQQEYPSLLTFGRALASKSVVPNDRASQLRTMAIASGRIAAACEKIDHLEEVMFRAEVRAGIAVLARLALALLAAGGLDPVDAVQQRLQSVKHRLKLHGRI